MPILLLACSFTSTDNLKCKRLENSQGTCVHKHGHNHANARRDNRAHHHQSSWAILFSHGASSSATCRGW